MATLILIPHHFPHLDAEHKFYNYVRLSITVLEGTLDSTTILLVFNTTICTIRNQLPVQKPDLSLHPLGIKYKLPIQPGQMAQPSLGPTWTPL